MSEVRNYEQVDEFIAYTDQEEWRVYIEETVVPLWASAWRLKKFHEQLQQEFDERSLETLTDAEQQLFLGGVDARRDEVYRRNSLAQFYKELFGARVADLQSWVLSEGSEMQTEVHIEVKETQFVEFASRIYDRLTRALSSQSMYHDWHEPDVEFEVLLEDADQLRELVEELYQRVLGFAVNHSYHTFFLWSLNQVPRHFVETAYSELDVDLSLVRDQFGLRNFEWKNPIKPDADIYQDYQILCFPEYDPASDSQSFGGSIARTNELIWSYFDSYSKEAFRDALSLYFNQVPNLKQQYKDLVTTRVGDVPESWIDSRFNIYFKGLSASTEGRSEAANSQDSIMDLLDQAAPVLFLGLNKVSQVYDDRLRVKEVGG